jgi:hypothetical protein
MKKLIEIKEQEYLVMCDNPSCDYKVKNPTKDPYTNIDEFLNKPCPECGENLLTQEDLTTYKQFLKTVDMINKWLGWLTIFIPKKYERKGRAHIYKGVRLNSKPAQRRKLI